MWSDGVDARVEERVGSEEMITVSIEQCFTTVKGRREIGR